MSKWTKAQILNKTAGAKVHKSLQEAIKDMTATMEKQHFEIFNKPRPAAKPKKKDSR